MEQFMELKYRLKRVRNLSFALGLLTIVGGLGLCLWGAAEDKILRTIILLLSFSFIVVGFKLLYDALKEWDIEEHRLIRLLKFQPEKIVWVYSVNTELAPFGIRLISTGMMYFKLNDRSEICVPIPSKQLKKISASLNSRLSHATFGYTLEREQWYEVSPYLLNK